MNEVDLIFNRQCPTKYWVLEYEDGTRSEEYVLKNAAVFGLSCKWKIDALRHRAGDDKNVKAYIACYKQGRGKNRVTFHEERWG